MMTSVPAIPGSQKVGAYCLVGAYYLSVAYCLSGAFKP